MRQELLEPCSQLLRLLFLIGVSLGIGLFPYIDNFAHVGGLVCGCLAFAYVTHRFSLTLLQLADIPAVPHLFAMERSCAPRVFDGGRADTGSPSIISLVKL